MAGRDDQVEALARDRVEAVAQPELDRIDARSAPR